MIITVTLNPAVDKTLEIKDFQIGTVNRVSAIRTDAGGKGINVSKVIKSLGGSSRAVGILAGTAGEFIKQYLDSQKIENSFLFVGGETRTNIKIADADRKTNTDINEPGPAVSHEDMEKVKHRLLESLKGNEVVVFSGSVPSNADKALYKDWIAAVRTAGARAILDADGELLRLGLEAGPYMVKPNIHELERYHGGELKDAYEIEQVAVNLIEKFGIELVAVSLGEKGAIFINKEGSILAQGIRVDVKSTVGAGDSMVAALAYSIDNGYGLEKAVRLAVAAGTANVMTSGSQAAGYDTIMELEKRVTFEYINSNKK